MAYIFPTGANWVPTVGSFVRGSGSATRSGIGPFSVTKRHFRGVTIILTKEIKSSYAETPTEPDGLVFTLGRP